MTQTLIVTSSDRCRLPEGPDKPFVALTPLDAIVRLERTPPIEVVVLAGSFVRDRELAHFLDETYPTIHVECEA